MHGQKKRDEQMLNDMRWQLQLAYEGCSASGTLDHELHHIQEMLTAWPSGFNGSEYLCGFHNWQLPRQYAALIGILCHSNARGFQPTILLQKHHDGHLSDILIW